MYHLDPFPDVDVSQQRERTEYRRQRCVSVEGEERHVVHFQSIGQVPYSSTVSVRVCYDDNTVSPGDELLCQMVYVELHTTWLWVEEVTNHTSKQQTTHVSITEVQIGASKPTGHLRNVIRHCVLFSQWLEPIVQPTVQPTVPSTVRALASRC